MMLSNVGTLKEVIKEIPFESAEYPDAWRKLADAPKRIYAIGDLSLLRGKKLVVVGSRLTPPNALKLGKEIARVLSGRMTLVTGTADGGDTAAIEGALAGEGKIICVLAGGFSSLPQSNLTLLERVAKRGLLISPHSFETPVRTFSYAYRNKLLAAIAEGVLVLGAGEKSRALMTANYAAERGRPVFALPYPPNSLSGCGCNALLKRGGYLVENAADVASHYGIRLEEEEREISLTPDEERAYGTLKERLECHVNELAALTGVPSFKLRGILSALEVKGLIVPLGGNRYAPVR